LIDVRADGFAHRSDRIDEGNLHGEKRIRGMLDEFRAFSAGYDDRRRDGSAIGLRDGSGGFVIFTAGEWSVDLAKNGGTAVIVAADDDAIGKQEVGDGGAFAQEFRVGSDVERTGIGAVAKDDFANPLAGVDGTVLFSTMTL